MGGALGRALLRLLDAACFSEEETLFEKTFPTECVRTGMLTACCLHPEEEKFFEKKFPGFSQRVCAH